ncbi:hypothetical protein SGUI_2269 [Serinicoccus hydrothermalis]|uniref:TolA protein n=1 Tax=Serinicoccus hydrothermalis TaxID=1758689 RepID=A0A1B1NE84_9MICO|nr:hypothetical protein [Serinicoccus hydrothermalis]ANS79665.1 hypothetical protein SGUI_2269 [Serinicoccus hydrothermalis]
MAEESDEEALHAAVSAVYAVAPADFVATRKEWVARLRSEGRKDIAKEVGALRKPSVSAAAVNSLVRAEDPVVGRLRDVGARLRHAQSAMDAAGLSGLRGDRDDLLRSWIVAAREHSDAPLTATVEAEVRDTAVAALADPAATEVVLGGTLTRALSYSGFGEVDIADAVARTSTGVVLTRIEGGGGAEAGAGPETEPPGTADGNRAGDGDETGDIERLRAALEAAESEVTAARDRRRAASEAADAAAEKVRVAESGVDQARRLLAQAEKHAESAQRSATTAQEARERADAELTDARARRDGARTRLEEAEDG